MLRPTMSRLAPELLAMRGVSTVTAAGLIGHAGNLRNCRNADAFAMRAGTAPVSCSSGKHAAVRVNLGGNRKLNSLLHSIAIHQLRAEEHPSRIDYERKRGEGKAQRAALRASLCVNMRWYRQPSKRNEHGAGTRIAYQWNNFQRTKPRSQAIFAQIQA